MKYLIVFFNCILIHSQESDSLLVWQKNVPLEFNHYKMMVKDSTQYEYSALSRLSINVEFEIDNDKVNYSVNTVFHKLKSFIILKDSVVLKHEQLHFDIAELFAMKIRRDFKKLKEDNIIDISKYRKKYDEHVDDMESKQQEFDNDTHLYLVNNFNITDSRTAFSFSENIKSNNKLLYTSHAKWLKWIKQEFTKATSR